MINEQIRDREVRLIGTDGEQLGIMSAREAMKLAQEAELDLVKIAPGANRRSARLLITESISMSRPVRKKRPRKSRELLKSRKCVYHRISIQMTLIRR